MEKVRAVFGSLVAEGLLSLGVMGAQGLLLLGFRELGKSVPEQDMWLVGLVTLATVYAIGVPFQAHVLRETGMCCDAVATTIYQVTGSRLKAIVGGTLRGWAWSLVNPVDWAAVTNDLIAPNLPAKLLVGFATTMVGNGAILAGNRWLGRRK